jgi:hypothetical protein
MFINIDRAACATSLEFESINATAMMSLSLENMKAIYQFVEVTTQSNFSTAEDANLCTKPLFLRYQILVNS